MLDQLIWATVGAVIGGAIGWGLNGLQHTLARRKQFDEEFESRRLTLRLLWVDRSRLDSGTFRRQFATELDALADLMHRAGKQNYALKVAFLNRYFSVSAAFNHWLDQPSTAEFLEAELEHLLCMAPAGIPPLLSKESPPLELMNRRL